MTQYVLHLGGVLHIVTEIYIYICCWDITSVLIEVHIWQPLCLTKLQIATLRNLYSRFRDAGKVIGCRMEVYLVAIVFENLNQVKISLFHRVIWLIRLYDMALCQQTFQSFLCNLLYGNNIWPFFFFWNYKIVILAPREILKLNVPVSFWMVCCNICPLEDRQEKNFTKN